MSYVEIQNIRQERNEIRIDPDLATSSQRVQEPGWENRERERRRAKLCGFMTFLYNCPHCKILIQPVLHVPLCMVDSKLSLGSLFHGHTNWRDRKKL